VSLATALAVGAGGSAGAVARFLVDRAVTGERGTVVVNVAGSILLGAVVASDLPSTAALALGTGFCGAFTTFSSFAVTTVERLGDGDAAGAGRYAVGTLVAAVAGALLGAWLAG
jgi:CrcB protein